MSKLSPNLLLLAGILSLLGACSKKSNVESITNGLYAVSPSPTPAVVNSCEDLGYFSSISACKQTTFAKCVVQTATVAGVSASCYQPVSGYQVCTVPANRPSWAYSNYGAWCIESVSGSKQIRKQTAAQSACDVHGNSQCDCPTAPQPDQRCSVNNTSYPACVLTSTPVLNCATMVPFVNTSPIAVNPTLINTAAVHNVAVNPVIHATATPASSVSPNLNSH